jgi:DNA modification methylase
MWETTDHETVRLFQGDVLDVLRRLPSCSVQTVMTSPPYWGLRDYGTADWEGGNPECDHVQKQINQRKFLGGSSYYKGEGEGRACTSWTTRDASVRLGGTCKKCGARRIDQQIGSERTPQEYVVKMVEVFREVRRVLRDDGTLWLNMGDGYNANTGKRFPGTGQVNAVNSGQARETVIKGSGLKSGNLVGMPWRLALALQEDGWILRQDIIEKVELYCPCGCGYVLEERIWRYSQDQEIIWHKPSPMPESVRNRCTKAHEYLFLLAKRMGYYYDADAIKEKVGDPTRRNTDFRGEQTPYKNNASYNNSCEIRNVCPAGEDSLSGRNKRSVWTIAAEGYAGGHFATFPMKLVEPCILAGTSERGCCEECGAPWRRVLETKRLKRIRPQDYVKRSPPKPKMSGNDSAGASWRKKGDILNGPEYARAMNTCANSVAGVDAKTVGWEPTCSCEAGVVPCVVLDPFIGSGTTAIVAIDRGRRCWGIDLSEKYLREYAIPRVEGELFRRPSLASLVRVERKRFSLRGKSKR